MGGVSSKPDEYNAELAARKQELEEKRNRVEGELAAKKNQVENAKKELYETQLDRNDAIFQSRLILLKESNNLNNLVSKLENEQITLKFLSQLKDNYSKSFIQAYESATEEQEPLFPPALVFGLAAFTAYYVFQ